MDAESIIHAADCVMVARGDLGIELNIEEVPLVQKRIIALAGELARPVITATQMLESMVTSTRPTRAEVTDVANAILDGTDAVMLSQETAIGAHPVETVEMMEAIARRTEQDVPYEQLERGARAAPLAKGPGPRLHGGLQRHVGRAPARAQRARDPHPLGPLGAAGGRAPPPGAGLRALAAGGDGPPVRADLGRRGREHRAPRGDRGADRRRGPPGRGAGLGEARASGSAITAGLPSGRPDTTSLLQIQAAG